MHDNNRKMNLTFLAVPVVGIFLAYAGSIPPAHGEDDKKTARSWKAKCASCHGEDGKGATEQGKKMGIGDMTGAAYWKDGDAALTKAVSEGVKGKSKDGKDQEMKGFKDKLKPEEIDALIKYAKAFKK